MNEICIAVEDLEVVIKYFEEAGIKVVTFEVCRRKDSNSHLLISEKNSDILLN